MLRNNYRCGKRNRPTELIFRWLHSPSRKCSWGSHDSIIFLHPQLWVKKLSNFGFYLVLKNNSKFNLLWRQKETIPLSPNNSWKCTLIQENEADQSPDFLHSEGDMLFKKKTIYPLKTIIIKMLNELFNLYSI